MIATSKIERNGTDQNLRDFGLQLLKRHFISNYKSRRRHVHKSPTYISSLHSISTISPNVFCSKESLQADNKTNFFSFCSKKRLLREETHKEETAILLRSWLNQKTIVAGACWRSFYLTKRTNVLASLELVLFLISNLVAFSLQPEIMDKN